MCECKCRCKSNRVSFLDALLGLPYTPSMAEYQRERAESAKLRAKVAQERADQQFRYYNPLTQYYSEKWGYNLDSIGSNQRTIKEQVITELGEALKSTQHAYNIAVGAQPLAADIPAFQQVQKVSRDIQDLMQQISRLRGL